MINREAQLRVRLAQLETIYRAVPVGLAYVNIQMELVELNQALAEINGLPIEAQLGKRPSELLPPPLAEAVERLSSRVMRARQPLSGVEIAVTSQANPNVDRDWLASYHPVIENESVNGIVVALLEVTQLKESQRKLEEANRLLEQRILERTRQIAEANTELQAFAHIVAHDLRAPNGRGAEQSLPPRRSLC